MSQLPQHSPHTFFWVDLGTPHVTPSRSFYANLFGWGEQADQIDQWTYVKFLVEGQDVAALYQIASGQIDLGYPIAWMPYLWVEDVDAATERLKLCGGKVKRGPFDAGDQGRTTSALDPTGAMFYLWQPNQHRGAQLLNHPGALSWVELTTPNLARAEQFYVDLLGWESVAQRVGDERYVTFYQNGQPVAGMVEAPDQAPRWRVYFGVKSCDATAAHASALGGEITIPPTDMPGRGRFAALRDPQGVGFAILELSGRDHHARFPG